MFVLVAMDAFALRTYKAFIVLGNITKLTVSSYLKPHPALLISLFCFDLK